MKLQNISCCLLMASLLMALSMQSCNSSDEASESYTSTSVAIQGFSLKANSNVMSDLDSVFFSIDLDKGVVFNADSLPKGTVITKLIPIITLPSVKSAVINMEGGSYKTGESDYLSNPSDTIDFSGTVTLDVTALDGVTQRTYSLKVNVHQMDPDSLYWDEMAWSKLPSRLPAPIKQKSVTKNGQHYSLIQESDLSFTLAESLDTDLAEWKKSMVTLPEDADIRSLCASDNDFFILAGSSLYSSADGLEWTLADSGWVALMGSYQDSALGVRQTGDGQLLYTMWPAQEGWEDTEMDSQFPIHGASNLVDFSNKWTEKPIVFMVGGQDLAGDMRSCVWGFDGDRWTQIGLNTPPAVKYATVIPYYVYLQTSALWVRNEITAWILIGGQLADGTLNDTVYVSYDTGVNWHEADTSLQLPDFIPAMQQLDGVVSNIPMTGSLQHWTRMVIPGSRSPMRLQYEIDGLQVDWKCPYIYLFGGCDANGALYDTVWRGVINRMRFVPII